MKRLNIAMAAALALTSPPAFADHHAAGETAQLPAARIQAGSTPFDWKAREQQVSSGDQRIEPLSEQDLPPEAQQISDQIGAFFGSGGEQGVSKNFATMARHPGLFRHQTLLGLELNQNGQMPPREREMVILRTAWLVRSPFEWGEHVKYGKRLGLTSEEIERITQGSSAAGWNEHDRAILRGVEELLGDHAVSDGTWATLARTWNDKQLLELPGLVGSYTLTAMLFSTLRFGLMPGNEGFGQR